MGRRRGCCRADILAIWQTGVLGGQVRKVLANARGAVPSPDGRQLAYLTPELPLTQTIMVSGLDGRDARRVAEQVPSFPPVRPAWSHDGRWLSYVRAGLFAPANLFVVDMSTGRERQVTRFSRPPEGIGQHVWLPGNRHLAVSYVPYSRALATSDLAILDVEDGSLSRFTATIGDTLLSPSVSADGSRLIATTTRYVHEIWKFPVMGGDPDANGRAGVRLVDSSLDPLWIFVSRNARTLLFNSPASGSRNLWTSQLDGNARPRQITAVTGDAIAHSSLSPDGMRVAFVSFAAGNSDIWVQNVDGSNPRQLTNDPAADSWPVWSPDGRSIVFTSVRDGAQETRVIPSEGATSQKLVDGFFRGDWIRRPAGEGTLIVTSDGENGVRLIDPERRSIVWDTRLASASNLPMFSRDGQRISVPSPEGRDHHVVQILDVATGKGRVAARLPFNVTFRASWVDNDTAVIVNRQDTVSHIVLFDRFWSTEPAQ